ncbi:MAG: response regulator transcription factor [Gemmatimonadetes bacterium]|nr:response regulator transcription factor [Gemmatimonadota bacterium]
MTGSRYRVVIADDHLVVREGLKLILETEEDFELVGQAQDGATAVQLARDVEPDLILMDLRMPGMGGIEAIEQIRDANPDTAVVILTTYDEDNLMVRGLRAGARGYLLKDVDRETLFHTMRAAVRGNTVLSAEAVSTLLARSKSNNDADPSFASTSLTPRELQILGAITRGRRNKDIGADLGITERTVKAHVSSIYAKLGVASRAAAAATAISEGLVSPGSP